MDNGRYRRNVVIPKFRPCKIGTNIYRRRLRSAKSSEAAPAKSDTDPCKHRIQRWLRLEIEPRARFVPEQSFGVVSKLSEQNALSALSLGALIRKMRSGLLPCEHVIENLQFAFPIGNLAHGSLNQRCDESPMLNLFLSRAFMSRMVASVSPFTVISFSLPKLAPDASARVSGDGPICFDARV